MTPGDRIAAGCPARRRSGRRPLEWAPRLDVPRRVAGRAKAGAPARRAAVHTRLWIHRGARHCRVCFGRTCGRELPTEGKDL